MVRLTHNNNTGDKMKNTNEITKQINYDTDMNDVFRLKLNSNSKKYWTTSDFDKYVDVQVLDMWNDDIVTLRVLDTDLINGGYGYIDNDIEDIRIDDIESVEFITYLNTDHDFEEDNLI
jgi:hypothetical protein